MEITFKNESVKLAGNPPKVGEKIPNTVVETAQGEKVNLHDLIKGVTILSIVPNVTTSVCSTQTKRFAEGTKDKDYQYLSLSVNTPEEWQTWKSENDVDNQTFTDVDLNFGKESGLLMEDLGLLARSAFVLDKDAVVQYVQIVPEGTDEPSYDEAIAAADKI